MYLGEVENNRLVKIKTTDDLEGMKENPALKTEWQGSIPYPDNISTLIGAQGEVIVYDNQTAYIVGGSELREVKLQGVENYVSADGAELIQLSKAGTSTYVELQPLKP